MIPFVCFFINLFSANLKLDQLIRTKGKPSLNNQNILVGLLGTFVNLHPLVHGKTFIQKGSDTKTISDTDCLELCSLAEAMGAAQKIQRGFVI